MFGGLQLKGADDEAEPTPETSARAAPAPGLSSFGFMNAGASEPAPAPAVSSFSFLNPASSEPSSETPAETSAAPVAAASGFSFMTTTSDEPEPTAETAPAPATSGFSFMMQDSTATDAPEPAPETPAPVASGFSFMVQDSTTAPPEPPPETPDPAPATTTSGFSFMGSSEAAAETPAPAPASSGFDFMNSMSTTPAVEETPAPAPAVEETMVPTIAEESPAKPALQGGFWSLSAPISETAPPKTIHARTNSVSSASSALSAPSLPPAPNPTPTKTGGVIAGAGVTFGTSAAKPRIKKKKSRAARVGVGASHSQPTTPAVTPAPAPVPSTTPEEEKSSRDAALEASNRAEAFMQAKAIEQAKSSPETPTKSASDLEILPTESTDEVLTAAKKAAEEAKMMQQQKGKGGGFMGTFFKGFRPSTTSMTSSGSVGNNSKHSVGSQSAGSNSSANAVDRLAKEQQAMKQAMAKRQLEQHKEQQESKPPTIAQIEQDDEDDDVVVSTSVGGYTPAAEPEPMEYTPVSDSVTKTTISEVSTFVPPPIPQATQKSAFGFDVPVYGQPQQTISVPIVEAPKPKPKLNNTPKDKFEHHQDYFSEAVNQAMKKVEDARSLKKGLLEERFVALAKDRFAAREIEQIEELLQTAIDEEDYELADELGQKLDAHKREKGEVENMLQYNKQALERLGSENTSLGELVVSAFEDLALRLDNLKKTELESEKKDDKETLTQYATISKQLSAEHERLQQDLKHLERDELLVGEERQELEDSIKDQTGEIEIEKDKASLELTEAEKEIEELRKAIQIKQQEAADLRTKVFGYEDSISKVRVKFARQLSRVDKKEISVKESRREWEIENEQHKKQKEAHELQVKSHSDTLLAHEELMKTLDSELKLSKEFSEIIPGQLGFMEDDSESEEKDDDDEGSLAQLKANVVKCEGAIDVAKRSLKMATMIIQNLETEREMLVDRIPDLETRKKAAAAARDFKSAGKFSKEIKDANARIKQCEDDLDGEAKIKKASAEEELRELDIELLEAKIVADAKEKLSGEKRMETLARKISQLAKEKVEKCGDSNSDGKTVKSVAARVLEGQIMILKAEGLEIGLKYGGWDELMKSIGEHDETQGLEREPVGEVAEDEKQGEPDSGLSSKERLEKAKELLAQCSEMEQKVQEAAEKEDFEAAGELQEILDQINTEIEDLNITDEECLLLADADNVLDAAPSEQHDEVEEQCALTDEERLSKAKELLDKQSDLELKIEEAVKSEDFEAADEFQTSIDQIGAELEELNITDEEKEFLTAEGEATEVAAPVQEELEEDRPPVQEGEDAVSPFQEAEETTAVEEEEEKKEVDVEEISGMDNGKVENDEEVEEVVDTEPTSNEGEE